MTTSVSINGTTFSQPSHGEADWDTNLNAILAALRAAAAAVFVFGNSSLANAGTTFLRPQYREAVTDATEIKIRVPKAGVIRNLYVQAGTGPVTSGQTFTVRKNGVDQTLTCALAAAGTQASDTSHSFSVAAGDTLSVSVTGAPATGALQLFATMQFSPE